MKQLHCQSRGASLVLVAISLVVIMLMASLAIDLGRLLTTRAEAQRAADGAALAGASAFLDGVTGAAVRDEAAARAAQVAGQNDMAGQWIRPGTLEAGSPYSEVFEYVEVLAGDILDTVGSFPADVYPYVGDEVRVDVIPELDRVRVTIRRDTVGIWFARVVGLRSFPVGATATAHAALAGGVRCVRPIAVVDWWDETNNDDQDTNKNDIPDSNEQWLFEPPADSYVPLIPDEQGTGLGSRWRDPIRSGEDSFRDRGQRLVLRDQQQAGPGSACVDPKHCLGSGWWALWDPWALNANAEPMRISKGFSPLLTGEDCPTVQKGSAYGFKAGAVSAVKNEFEDILKADPGAKWDQADGVVGCAKCSGGDWRQSPRVWTLGILSPLDAEIIADPGIPEGGKRVSFNNFALFFFEGCATPSGKRQTTGEPDDTCKPGDDIVGTFIGIAPGLGPGTATLTRTLRLVK